MTCSDLGGIIAQGGSVESDKKRRKPFGDAQGNQTPVQRRTFGGGQRPRPTKAGSLFWALEGGRFLQHHHMAVDKAEVVAAFVAGRNGNGTAVTPWVGAWMGGFKDEDS